MQRCLQLAALGAGNVAPNPMVGAVVVYNGRIIGEGYHKTYGDAHAEVNSLHSISDDDRYLIPLSTMYVSLEPCAHFGKTPPCTDLIIQYKIPKLVIGCHDSFEAVNGKGVEKLQAAGIDLTIGVLEQDCRTMNKRFFTFHEKQRPFVILKWAQSSDGYIAKNNGERLLISNEFTNRLVHQWRAEESAILVGTHTALMDDPALTTRLWPGSNPLRLVIDAELKLPTHLKLFDGSVKTIVFNNLKQTGSENPVYHQLQKEKQVLNQILSSLHAMQIQSLIVEGGSKLLQSFIDEGLWDEARVITSDHLVIGQGLGAPLLKNHVLVNDQKIQSDLITVYKKDSAETRNNL